MYSTDTLAEMAGDRVLETHNGLAHPATEAPHGALVVEMVRPEWADAQGGMLRFQGGGGGGVGPVGVVVVLGVVGLWVWVPCVGVGLWVWGCGCGAVSVGL